MIEDAMGKVQRLWCQHCKALQKTNETVVKCWYNPLDPEVEAFCAANEDAVNAIFEDVAKEVAKETRRGMFKALKMACGIHAYADVDRPGIWTPNAVCMPDVENRARFKKLLFGKEVKE